MADSGRAWDRRADAPAALLVGLHIRYRLLWRRAGRRVGRGPGRWGTHPRAARGA